MLRSKFRLLGTASTALSILCGAAAAQAQTTPALTMDLTSGEVLFQQNATRPWFPASTTKLMTVYVALSAVRDGKIALNTPMVYSARARAVPPSKMGFRPGTQVTLDNALKMLMVKSANDIAITIAEGVSGSVEAFADDMNQAGAQLGLRESHFVNPNGLPNPAHVSSVRDMAIIARALYTEFPQYASYFDIGMLQLGPQFIPTHNNLLGRYPGADGMKTGFTCAAGFNVVASAFRDGRRVVAIVFGAPSVATRTERIAALFDRAFANVDRPTASVLTLPEVGGAAPDMHDQVCRNRAPLIAAYHAEVDQLDAALLPSSGGLALPNLGFDRNPLIGSAAGDGPIATRINQIRPEPMSPVLVHVGADPGYTGPVAQERAPHSPIGTETAPSTAEAYAAPETEVEGVGVAPLAVDPKALPMRGRRGKFAHGRHGRAAALAAAEAPKTKVIAGDEADKPAHRAAAAPKTPIAKTPLGKTTVSKAPAKSPVPRPVARKPAAHPTKTAAKKSKTTETE